VCEGVDDVAWSCLDYKPLHNKVKQTLNGFLATLAISQEGSNENVYAFQDRPVSAQIPRNENTRQKSVSKVNSSAGSASGCPHDRFHSTIDHHEEVSL
jgi:hypothetical protein